MNPLENRPQCPHDSLPCGDEERQKKRVLQGVNLGVRWFANYLWISTAIATLVLIFHLWQVVRHLDIEATATSTAIREQNLLIIDQNKTLLNIEKLLAEHREVLSVGDTITIARDKKPKKEM